MKTLETVSGKKINVTDPDPATIDISDIAWALSRMPRFSGHSIPYVPYSVAQHCIQVMKELAPHGPRIQMHGLLHDAAEAYINDLPSPIKHIPEIHAVISKLEDKLMLTIYEALGVEQPTAEEHTIVKIADKHQQAVEAYNFMHSRGNDWNLPKVTFKKLQEFEQPLTSVKAYDLFLQHFELLQEELTKQNSVA